MKKLMSVFAAFAVAITVVAALNGVSRTVSAADSCTDGTKYSDFDGSRTGSDTLTVWPKKPLCKDVNVNFTTFEVLNKNYNGQPFSQNPTALPQSSIFNKTVTLKKGSTAKVTVKLGLPDACTPYQIDAYIGPVQTKITTSAGLVDTTAIVGKIFQRTKSNCSAQVCNPATGQVITVHESEASKYKPVGDIACKPDVKVCNPANGQIITVKASEASKYKPVGDEACKDLPVCDLTTKKPATIKGYQYDSAKYSKNVNDAACQPAPEMLNVCIKATGEVTQIKKSEYNASVHSTDVNSCKKPETPEVPVVTPPAPQVKGEETPEAIASTGPVEVLSALFGTGSLAGAGTAYVRSRRALRK